MKKTKIDPFLYSHVVNTMRSFFLKKNFVEIFSQPGASIIAACEDIKNISVFTDNRSGLDWPQGQTGQLEMERAILKDDALYSKGVFGLMASTRLEPSNAAWYQMDAEKERSLREICNDMGVTIESITDMHDDVFPLFEFEKAGDKQTLIDLMTELVVLSGFNKPYILDYKHACNFFGTDKIGRVEEMKIWKYFGEAVILTNFPVSESYWNMQVNSDGTTDKCDLILFGVECAGGSPRKTDKKAMETAFLQTDNGSYAEEFFNIFGQMRVMDELDDYLSLPVEKPRIGCGIGVRRYMRAVSMLSQKEYRNNMERVLELNTSIL